MYCAGVLIICVFFAFFSPRLLAFPIPDSFVWHIRVFGPQVAYAYAKYAAVTQLPASERHFVAHRFGADVYAAKGLTGAGICDEAFDFGCFHGFSTQSIRTLGAGALPDLIEACKSSSDSTIRACEHGIGHGLMEYLGPSKLIDALYACDASAQADPLVGCTAGVFMEYNRSILFDAASTSVKTRVPVSSNLLAPCNTEVPQQYRESCYFEISLWWKDIFGSDFKRMGNLCSQATKHVEKISCWRGMGAIIAEESAYSIERARAACDTLPSETGSEWCQYGVIARLVGTGTHRESGRVMCEGLKGEVLTACRGIFSK
ncbi:MAG: hypothetical protein RIQ56_662 [Candidatus Parcubacteria bacterium]|jgi:hypothetical protein